MDNKKGNFCKRVCRFVFSKKQSECMHLCQSLTSVANGYIFFFSHKKANTALLFEGELHFCFVKGYFLFKCVKGKLK